MDKFDSKKYPLSEVTNQIIGIAIKVHKTIGPGFREKYYQRAMYLELQNSTLKFEREKKVPIRYGKIILDYHILDLMIENKVIVELKSMKTITDIEIGQLTTYLRLTKVEVGLLLNFGSNKLEIKRVKI